MMCTSGDELSPAEVERRRVEGVLRLLPERLRAVLSAAPRALSSLFGDAPKRFRYTAITPLHVSTSGIASEYCFGACLFLNVHL